MKDDIKQQIRELVEENKNYKLMNRRLLKNLTDLKYEYAKLLMKNARTEVELEQMKGELKHDK